MHSCDDLPQPKKYSIYSDHDVITKEQYEDDLWQLKALRVNDQNLFVQYHCNNQLTSWEYEVEVGHLNQQRMYLEHRLVLYFAQVDGTGRFVKDANELDVVLNELVEMVDMNHLKTRKKYG